MEDDLRTLTIPYSGNLLVSHLAAYGLASVLDEAGEKSHIGHHPDSLETEPQVLTSGSPERVTECVRNAAVECAAAVDADLGPEQPVIWSRPSNPDRARAALPEREKILDYLEHRSAAVAAGLLSGLGAPAIWLADKPQRGASALDGVAGNSTSDFVRGVLRGSRPAALAADPAALDAAWTGVARALALTDDKTLWSPTGTKVDLVHQWLAGLGLSALPVGLRSDDRAGTPGHWRAGAERGLTLPVLARPVSVARLRALLQLPELTHLAAPSNAARLRSLGIRELLTFRVVDQSTPQMTKFSFERGRRTGL